MNPRDRVRASLNHRQPDRVAVDFGGTPCTGIHVWTVEKLRRRYGLDDHPVKVIEPLQMLGEIEPDLGAVLGSDAVALNPHTTIFGFTNDGAREFRLPWGQVALVPDGFQTTEVSGQGLYIYPEGDRSVPPSGYMPEGSFFFDVIIRQVPLDEDQLRVEDNLEEFGPVTEDALLYFEREARRLAGTGLAVVGNLGGTALGDIALVPASFLKHPRGIRDITEWYMSLAVRREFIHQIFSRQTDTALANLAKIHARIGDGMDVAFVCGTDFGTQDSQFCSVETFNSLYAPYYRQINGWIHRNTSWKTFKHCCGAAEVFMESFIASGFDIINPVQISAKGMDPKNLKDKYGDRLVFWGGGVNTQKTLPFGTPAAVREEVLRLLEIFAPAGGFVFNTVHNIQANVPIENVAAMIEALKEFR